MKTTIFISTPISAFKENNDYVIFRNWIQNLVSKINESGWFSDVFCVANLVKNQTSLDDPKSSLINDLEQLDRSSHFLLIYPQISATSALIELGYAVAKNKTIMIVHPKQVKLPFMAGEMHNIYPNVTKMCIDDFNSKGVRDVYNFLEEQTK